MLPQIQRVAAVAFAPLLCVVQFLWRVFWSGLNERNIITFPLNFFINFLPVFTWLLIFKNAGLIPKDIRPTIHVSLAYHLDEFMFSITKSPLGSLLTIAATVMGGWLLYLKIYRTATTYKSLGLPTLSLTSLEDDIEMAEFDMSDTKDFTAPGSFQNHHRIGPMEIVPNLQPVEISENAETINRKIVRHLRENNNNRPYNCWYYAPPALLAASWFVLNVDHWFLAPLTVPKDVTAWFLYVIGHFCVPLFTAIWLYVFHAPGAIRLFSFALGAQNIVGVLTHLLFPNAPPWFIHKFGETAEANYDTKGYAAGLTRVKFATGTHTVTKGFHASPIVFGALPSLHSAMAVMCFFFVSYYSRWTISKVAVLAFVVLQWWATIYLDHHWRLDLIAGMAYSIVLYTIFLKWLMPRVDDDFVAARLRFDFQRGSTMGMRVFRNTKLQNFFDPLS